jgi:circadian clock protein KaiB
MTIVIKFFIIGKTPGNLEAIKNLESITKSIPDNPYKLEIIDLLESPEIAFRYRIIATPCLIRMEPPPPMRLIGNLSDKKKVLSIIYRDKENNAQRGKETNCE